MVLLFAAAPAAADRLEEAVEATYLYKLAAFVTWPRGGMPAADFVICVSGDPVLLAMTASATEGKTLADHHLAVRDGVPAKPGACQVLFANGGPGPTRRALEAVRGQPVLTVSDAKDVDDVGVVTLVRQQGRIQFEIDTAKAAQQHLQISSKLLSLAARVSDGS